MDILTNYIEELEKTQQDYFNIEFINAINKTIYEKIKSIKKSILELLETQNIIESDIDWILIDRLIMIVVELKDKAQDYKIGFIEQIVEKYIEQIKFICVKLYVKVIKHLLQIHLKEFNRTQNPTYKICLTEIIVGLKYKIDYSKYDTNSIYYGIVSQMINWNYFNFSVDAKTLESLDSHHIEQYLNLIKINSPVKYSKPLGCIYYKFC